MTVTPKYATPQIKIPVGQIPTPPDAAQAPVDHIAEYAPIQRSASAATALIGTLFKAGRELTDLRRETQNDGIYGDERFATGAAQIFKTHRDALPTDEARGMFDRTAGPWAQVEKAENALGTARQRNTAARRMLIETATHVRHEMERAASPEERAFSYEKFKSAVSIARSGGLIDPDTESAYLEGFAMYGQERQLQLDRDAQAQRTHALRARDQALSDVAERAAQARAYKPRRPHDPLPGLSAGQAVGVRIARLGAPLSASPKKPA